MNLYGQFLNFSMNWRAKYFLPILKSLARWKISPNQITTFRLIFIFPIAFYFQQRNLWGVLIFYLLFWFLDLIDGSLARYLQIENDKGRFLDTVVDNFMYSFAILGFIYLGAASAYLLTYNILIELILQLLAIIKKREKETSNWLIKAQADLPYFKTIIHLVLILYLFGADYLDITFIFVNTFTTILAFYYFIIIKNRN